jgi:hypothetical protein
MCLLNSDVYPPSFVLRRPRNKTVQTDIFQNMFLQVADN